MKNRSTLKAAASPALLVGVRWRTIKQKVKLKYISENNTDDIVSSNSLSDLAQERLFAQTSKCWSRQMGCNAREVRLTELSAYYTLALCITLLSYKMTPPPLGQRHNRRASANRRLDDDCSRIRF